MGGVGLLHLPNCLSHRTEQSLAAPQLDWNQRLYSVGTNLPCAGNPNSDVIMQYQATEASQPKEPRHSHTLQLIVISLPLYYPVPPMVPLGVELCSNSSISTVGGTCPSMLTCFRTLKCPVLVCTMSPAVTRYTIRRQFHRETVSRESYQCWPFTFTVLTLILKSLPSFLLFISFQLLF